jgi:hypothetical protein
MTAFDAAPDKGEKDGCDPVVEEAFAFYKKPKPAADAIILEHGNYRDRIGGRDQHAEKDSRHDWPGQKIHHARGDYSSGNHCSHKRQHENRNSVPPKLPPVNVDCCFEKEGRKNNGEDQVVGQNQTSVEPGQRKANTGNDEANGIR